jgi:hypothetical protein
MYSDKELIEQLEAKGFYGLIDKLQRAVITEDQARRSLAGDKDAISLLKTQRPDEPLIFARTSAEIAGLQKSGQLR